jgi:hypothetical protein
MRLSNIAKNYLNTYVSPELVDFDVIKAIVEANTGKEVFLNEGLIGLELDIAVDTFKDPLDDKLGVDFTYEFYGNNDRETEAIVSSVIKENKINTKLCELMKDLGSGSALFRMIIVGPGIKSNPYCLTDHKVFVYDIMDTTGNIKVSFPKLIDMCMLLDFLPIPSLKIRGKYSYDLPNFFPTLHQDFKNLKSGLNKDVDVNIIKVRGSTDPTINFTLKNNG